MERALRPGKFIDYGTGWSFVSDLEAVATQVEAMVPQGAPERAVALYELFIAGCYEKAEELDDSSGEFGTFVAGLFRRWVQAREAATAKRDETAAMLLMWIDDDRYGFCSHLERDVVNVLIAGGLAALAEAVRSRCDETIGSGHLAAEMAEHRYKQRQWIAMLKAISAVQ
jgi:hypothetical protein